MELLIYQRLLTGPLRYQYDGNAASPVNPRLARLRWWRKSNRPSRR